MPYTIAENDEGQFCVYRADENEEPQGDTLGCHDTQDEATAQIGAIEANEGKAAPPHVVKEFDFAVLEHREDGGKIRITTPAPDRIGDRVMPLGAIIENYQRNPIVQYGHNYSEPWATIGRTNALELKEDGVVADFTLRPAANEQDPQNIVRLLWAGKWLRASSVGFLPIQATPNDAGGSDYGQWELLEWSLVPVPMNPQALSMALKAFGPVQREGRVVSGKDIEMFDGIVDALTGATKQIRAYVDSHRPEQRAVDVDNAANTDDTNEQPQTLSDEAIAVLREFQTYLREVKL